MLQMDIYHYGDGSHIIKKVYAIKGDTSYEVSFDKAENKIDLSVVPEWGFKEGDAVNVNHYNINDGGMPVFDYNAKKTLISIEPDENGIWAVTYS